MPKKKKKAAPVDEDDEVGPGDGGDCPAAERDALVDLHEATDNGLWLTRQGWTSAPVRFWVRHCRRPPSR